MNIFSSEPDLKELAKNIVVDKKFLKSLKDLLVKQPELRGARGKQGAKGDRGAKGAKGDKGDKGDRGAVGATGDRGATGPQGLKGDKGSRGSKGDQGLVGPAGPQGLQGIVGATGPSGSLNDLGNGWKITTNPNHLIIQKDDTDRLAVGKDKNTPTHLYSEVIEFSTSEDPWRIYTDNTEFKISNKKFGDKMKLDRGSVRFKGDRGGSNTRWAVYDGDTNFDYE